MTVEAYFRSLRATIDACLWVQTRSVRFDQRATHHGMIRGDIYFVDGSVLHVREFVDTEGQIERLPYSYQYMDGRQRLVFRYDNTGHHRRLNLPTYPHHKHAGREDAIVLSEAPTLGQVLDEISRLVQLPPEEDSL